MNQSTRLASVVLAIWRGQWVEIRNPSEPIRIHTRARAATWGRAAF